MDLSYYYTPSVTATASVITSNLSAYLPVSIYNVDKLLVDGRFDVIEGAQSNLQMDVSALEAEYVTLSNICVNVSGLSKRDSDTWHDFIGPIINTATDFGSELFEYYLRRLDPKQVFSDIFKQLMNAGQDPDVIIQDDDDELPPAVQTDFRLLSSNVFATDRTLGRVHKSWGVTLDRDFNMLSGSKLSLLDPGALTTTGSFGANYSAVMSDAAKYPIMDFSNISLDFNLGTFRQSLLTSNFAASNIVVNNLISSNVTCRKLKVTDGSTDLLGGSMPAEINQDGSASMYALNVNNNFLVRPNGDVLVNGKLVIDGRGSVICYDDAVLPATAGYQLSDLLSGNIGSDDLMDFADYQPNYSEQETTAPLNFSGCVNKDDALQIVLPEMAPSDTASVYDALSRAQSTAASVTASLGTNASLPPQPTVGRVFSLDENDLFDIDISTGKYVGETEPSKTSRTLPKAPPNVAEAETEALGMQAFSRFVGASDLTNAPLHGFGQSFMTHAGFAATDKPAFPGAYSFTPEDNMWNQSVIVAKENGPWVRLAEIAIEAVETMEQHVGILPKDEFIQVQPKPDPPNAGEDEEINLWSWPSNAAWNN